MEAANLLSWLVDRKTMELVWVTQLFFKDGREEWVALEEGEKVSIRWGLLTFLEGSYGVAGAGEGKRAAPGWVKPPEGARASYFKMAGINGCVRTVRHKEVVSMELVERFFNAGGMGKG